MSSMTASIGAGVAAPQHSSTSRQRFGTTSARVRAPLLTRSEPISSSSIGTSKRPGSNHEWPASTAGAKAVRHVPTELAAAAANGSSGHIAASNDNVVPNEKATQQALVQQAYSYRPAAWGWSLSKRPAAWGWPRWNAAPSFAYSRGRNQPVGSALAQPHLPQPTTMGKDLASAGSRSQQPAAAAAAVAAAAATAAAAGGVNDAATAAAAAAGRGCGNCAGAARPAVPAGPAFASQAEPAAQEAQERKPAPLHLLAQTPARFPSRLPRHWL